MLHVRLNGAAVAYVPRPLRPSARKEGQAPPLSVCWSPGRASSDEWTIGDDGSQRQGQNRARRDAHADPRLADPHRLSIHRRLRGRVRSLSRPCTAFERRGVDADAERGGIADRTRHVSSDRRAGPRQRPHSPRHHGYGGARAVAVRAQLGPRRLHRYRAGARSAGRPSRRVGVRRPRPRGLVRHRIFSPADGWTKGAGNGIATKRPTGAHAAAHADRADANRGAGDPPRGAGAPRLPTHHYHHAEFRSLDRDIEGHSRRQPRSHRADGHSADGAGGLSPHCLRGRGQRGVSPYRQSPGDRGDIAAGPWLEFRRLCRHR